MPNDGLKLDPVLAPPPVMCSVYGPKRPAQRATDISGIVSLKIKELFPDTRNAICKGGPEVSRIREATRAALSKVNMDMIGSDDSVNILCSEHGFGILGGFAYAEMIKTIKDVVEERTGCRTQLMVVAYIGFKEAREIIDYYGFKEYFHGRVRSATPFDAGIPIETEIGTLHGVAKLYDTRWIIHTHYDDPREIYAHRVIDRVTKPFGMSYARFETRSIYHFTFPTSKSGNFIGRVIADSPFVREKLAFSCFTLSSPDGIVGVDADNDLDKVGNRITYNILSSYGKMLELFRRVGDCIVVLDGGKWPYYVHAGGMIFGHLLFSRKDWFDLESDHTPESMHLTLGSVNTGIKAVVINQALIGLSLLGLQRMFPMIVANEEMAQTMRRDSCNSTFMDHATTTENLEKAIALARERSGTDRIIFFDGCYGSINLSPSMAEHLKEKSVGCSEVVDAMLPKWLKQRGIDPAAA